MVAEVETEFPQSSDAVKVTVAVQPAQEPWRAEKSCVHEISLQLSLAKAPPCVFNQLSNVL